MGQHLLAVVCAWCNRVVSAAPAGADVTHTICASCLDFTFNPVENVVESHAKSGPSRLPDRRLGFDGL